MVHPEGKPELTLAWPYIERELKRQLDLNASTILREMSAPVDLALDKIRDLAAERRAIFRILGSFRALTVVSKNA